MNDKKELERIRLTKKLKDKEILVLTKRRERRSGYLLYILYFAAVLFILETAFENFALFVNHGYTVGHFNVFFSAAIMFIISFINDFASYALWVLLGIVIFFIYEGLMNPEKDKELKLIKRLKSWQTQDK